jgi:hypothetical protein
MKHRIIILFFLHLFVTNLKGEWIWHGDFPWIYSPEDQEWSFWHSSKGFNLWDDSQGKWNSYDTPPVEKWIWDSEFPWVYSSEAKKWTYWYPKEGNFSLWKNSQEKWLSFDPKSDKEWTYHLEKDPFIHSTIFAGYFDVLWLDINGSVGDYVLGNDKPKYLNYPQIFSSNIIQIAVIDTHILFVNEDGSLWGMGDNQYGQLGRASSSLSRTNTPIKIIDSNVSYACVGRDYCSFFIKNDGSLWAMGRNQYGQLGDDTNITRETPVMICSDGVRQVSSSGSESFYLKQDGSLWGMGRLSEITAAYRKTPFQIVDQNVTFLTGGGSFLKNDGSLWQASDSSNWDILPDMDITKPIKLVDSGVIKVSGFQDGRHLMYTNKRQSLFYWDDPDPSDNIYEPESINLNKSGIIDLAIGGHIGVFLDKNGTLYDYNGTGFSIIANNAKK